MRFQPIPTLAALCLLACAAPTRADGASRTDASVTKSDFEWKGELASGGRVQVSTVNGDVRVARGTGKTIRVRGTKSGKDAGRVTIEVDAKRDSVSIAPKYPKDRNTDARVDFVVEVPAGIEVELNTVNGTLTAKDIDAALALHTVDGNISASACGDVRGNTVNGHVKVELPERGAKRAELEAVNGQLEVRMAGDIGASVKANTVNGAIDSDFPLSRSKEIVGSHASGKLGDGSAKIELSTVNGAIKIKRA
jgi:DUF4097 and DUF4098 domain-containing protein YvlB